MKFFRAHTRANLWREYVFGQVWGVVHHHGLRTRFIADEMFATTTRIVLSGYIQWKRKQTKQQK